MQVATQLIHSIKGTADRIEAVRAQLASLIPTTGDDSAPRALFPQHEALREGGASVAQDEPDMCGARVPPHTEMAAVASAPAGLPATSAPRVPPARPGAALARTPRAGPTQPPSEAADRRSGSTAEAPFQAATEPPTAGAADDPTTAASTEQAAAAELAAAELAAAASAAATVAGEPAAAEAADSVAAAPETSAAAEVPVAEAHSAEAHSAGGADDHRFPRRSRRAPAPAPLAAPAETPERQARATATPRGAATPHAASSHAVSSHAAASSCAASSAVDEQPDNDGCCAVCLEPEGFDDNPIVFCDGCEVGCHKDCYGLSEIPPGNWYCDRCKLSRTKQPSCPACPSHEGCFKRTIGGRWGGLAHVACALYLPACGFEPEGTMDEAGFAFIDPAHATLRCSLCPTAETKRQGYKIQCSHKKCTTAFHVTCAQRAGLHMATIDDGADGARPVVYCKKHTAEGKAESDRATAGGKAKQGKKPRKRKRR